ncbi:MAG TPA: hypothetical protein VM580_15415, partial [Labilithrix sp.]|nr:hypothetical protein [Labilithrix sp.]
MKWQRWHAVAAGALVVLAGVGAVKRSGNAPAAVDAGAAAEPPARVPEGLLAELYVASPNVSWTRLQRGIGGAVGILPSTLPGVLGALVNIDVSLTSELDGASPMFAVLAGDPDDPGVAIAVKLVDGRRARGLLTDGDTARFTAKEAPGMTLLVPNRSGERPFHYALTQNGYLLVTRHAEDLVELGPYTTRTLPSRVLPTESAVVVEIPESAIKKTLKPKLEALWNEGKAFLLAADERMRAERGRAPDFGDPASIVATIDAMLSRRVAIFGDLEKVRLALDVTEDSVVLVATLTPAAPGGLAKTWIDGMKLGDAAPVLALPAVSALALSTRDSEAEREEQANELEKAIATSLGPRLKEPAKLHDVVEAATKARGEFLALAVAVDEPSGVLLRSLVRDATFADKAIRGALDLTRVDPFKEMLRVRDLNTTSTELAGLGNISVSTLTREPKKSKQQGADAGAAQAARRAGAEAKDAAATGVAWLVEDGWLSLGASAEPLVTLKLGARADKKLA